MMALKNIENTEADSKPPPKRRNFGVKTKSKEHHPRFRPKNGGKRRILQRRASEAWI